MLSESFIASLLTSNTSQTPAAFRDVVNSTHIFAAQSGKAVVNVYSRERNSHEATVPFPERIRSLALAGDQDGPGILVLGTENGRLIFWETSTGRQISTPASHLQPITSLVVDPTKNFVLSGSEDANVAVWSIPAIMSFSAPANSSQTHGRINAPLRLFSNHRAAIASIAVGHSAGKHNFAVSISQDNTAIVWNYRTGKVLRNYLLPSKPVSLAIDPADRAFYIGYEDGSIQLVELFKTSDVRHPLYNDETTTMASQLSDADKWSPPSSEFGATECLTLSYDGTLVLSGHRSGHIARWDVGRRKYVSTIVNTASPVTNISMFDPTGFAKPSNRSSIVTHNIVKPRVDAATAASADVVPTSYTLQAQLTPTRNDDAFAAALEHQVFPDDLIAEGLANLASFRGDAASVAPARPEPAEKSDVDTIQTETEQSQSVDKELAKLKEQLTIEEAARHASVIEMTKLRERLVALEQQNKTLNAEQQRSQSERNQILAKKRELDLEARKAWFEAEKRGQKGDVVLQRTRDRNDMDDINMEDE